MQRRLSRLGSSAGVRRPSGRNSSRSGSVAFGSAASLAAAAVMQRRSSRLGSFAESQQAAAAAHAATLEYQPEVAAVGWHAALAAHMAAGDAHDDALVAHGERFEPLICDSYFRVFKVPTPYMACHLYRRAVRAAHM